MQISMCFGQMVAQCSMIVSQKAPIEAFCNTIMLH